MQRRRFLVGAGGLLVAGTGEPVNGPPLAPAADLAGEKPAAPAAEVTLFLSGDLMTGRGIDQILAHPSKPELYEPYVRSALEYVALAERQSGELPRRVAFDYIWGDALAEIERMQPAARIVNLETAVTASDEAWPGKGIHYRMHPENLPCLTAARLDCCVLANNHVLDWGRSGLAETLVSLRAAGLRIAGAGRDASEAAAPATIVVQGGRRVLVFAYAMPSSGVPVAWAATPNRSGVNMLEDLSAAALERIARQVRAHKRDGDIAVLSLHWGPNWGYEVGSAERAFARRLVDAAGVDLVHGHSSHHAKGIEIYRDRPILYGCGDLLDDYEGIGGYESYRAELGLMYFPTFDAAGGSLTRFVLVPTRIRGFRLNRANADEAGWLAAMLGREGAKLGTGVQTQPDRTLALRWS